MVFKVARNATNDHLFFDCDIAGSSQELNTFYFKKNFFNVPTFSTELLIEGLGRASPIEEPEACIYGYGAVRFLASMSIKDSDEPNASSSGKTRTKTVSQRLVRQGAMQLMILHLQLLNEYVSSTRCTLSRTTNNRQICVHFRELQLN